MVQEAKRLEDMIKGQLAHWGTAACHGEFPSRADPCSGLLLAGRKRRGREGRRLVSGHDRGRHLFCSQGEGPGSG